MARIRGVTTIVPSTDTAWSVKPHNNKEAADVGDLAQARKAELQHHSPMEKRSLECHPWIQGAAERQTVSPITSRQSRNKRPLVYVRVAQDRCLPKLQPEADFIPVWLSWTCARYPYHHPTLYIAPPLRPNNRPDNSSSISSAWISSSGVWGREVQQHRLRSQISKRNPCRLPIDERPGPSLRTPVEERSLHGLWRRGLAVASSQSHCPRNSSRHCTPMDFRRRMAYHTMSGTGAHSATEEEHCSGVVGRRRQRTRDAMRP